MKKTMKILYIVLAAIIALSPIICAGNVGNVNVTINDTSNGVNSITNTGGVLLGIIKVAGVFISVGILMVIGVKYMMGSAEEKAEYKKVMIPYIIGAVLVFAASAFADKIAGIASNLFE